MLLPILAAGFVYINTTAVNTDQLLALEPTKDNKGCLIHLITKNPFQVEEPCVKIESRIESANAGGTDYTPAIAGSGVGLALGLGLGFVVAGAANKRRKA